MKVAVEHHFTGATASLGGTYDSEKTMISSVLRQATGAGVEDKFISARAAAIVNIPEVFSSGSQFMPHVYKWSENIYWVFTASNATAAATRTIALTEFNAATSTLTYKGYITLSGTTVAGSKTVRSFRAYVYDHTTGTVSTSGSSTTITGSGTGFQSERIAVGARIGFGTTDPTAVTTWYEITAIASDTSLTINSPVTLSGGTSYVIEEIRVLAACTNATLINGGIHLIKGLNYSTFTPGGTTITEATTSDNIRASYLLTDGVFSGAATGTFTVTIAAPGVFTLNNHGLNNGDVVIFTTTGALPTGLTPATTLYYVVNAATNTFQVSATLNGSAITTTGTQSGTHTVHHAAAKQVATIAADDFVSNTDHSVYLVATFSTSATIVEYNMRAALTVGAMGSLPNIASGTSPSAYLLKTGTLAVTGTPSQVNCGRIFTVNHGSASGAKSLYWVTTTRVYRCPLANISAASTSWLADAMLEVPPGGAVTYSALSTMNQIDYSSSIDRVFITNTGGRLGLYLTQYVTDGSQFEKYVGTNLNRLKLTTTPGGASDGLFPTAALTIWTEDGWMFAVPNVTTSGQNWLYVFPFAADGYYNSTSNQHIITPKLATPNATRLHHVYVDHQEYAGTMGLGFPVESYRMWYRTSGIDDNSGAWTEVPLGADLSAASPGTHIQFKIAFDILGEICVPTRIFSVCCIYEDSSQDSHYQPSLTYSSAASRQFAWKQVTSWSGNIPDLQIRLYNASTNFLVLDDTVGLSGSGDWEYSSNNGSTWAGWSAGADSVGNYIRYTADTLPNNITVKAILTQV
jgi:hypothetical protein